MRCAPWCLHADTCTWCAKSCVLCKLAIPRNVVITLTVCKFLRLQSFCFTVPGNDGLSLDLVAATRSYTLGFWQSMPHVAQPSGRPFSSGAQVELVSRASREPCHESCSYTDVSYSYIQQPTDALGHNWRCNKLLYIVDNSYHA